MRFLGGRVPTEMNSGVFGNEEWGMEAIIFTSAFTEERERDGYGGT